jgi:hypothetical protein
VGFDERFAGLEAEEEVEGGELKETREAFVGPEAAIEGSKGVSACEKIDETGRERRKGGRRRKEGNERDGGVGEVADGRSVYGVIRQLKISEREQGKVTNDGKRRPE